MNSSDNSSVAPSGSKTLVLTFNRIVSNNVVGRRPSASPIFTETGRNDRAAAQVLDHGLNEHALDQWLAVTGLPRLQVFAALGEPQAVRAHGGGRTLDAAVAERLLRLSELFVMARRVFGSGATVWLTRPHDLLDGKSPLLAAKSEFGGLCVRNMLLAIEHGGVV